MGKACCQVWPAVRLANIAGQWAHWSLGFEKGNALELLGSVPNEMSQRRGVRKAKERNELTEEVYGNEEDSISV